MTRLVFPFPQQTHPKDRRFHIVKCVPYRGSALAQVVRVNCRRTSCFLCDFASQKSSFDGTDVTGGVA